MFCKIQWKTVGYYPISVQGRIQVYNRVINLEISDLEKQGLKEILEAVNNIAISITKGHTLD